MIDTLETPRLYLRPLELEGAAQTQLLFPHWEVVRFLNSRVPWPYPPDGAETHFREVILPAMARGTQWHWTLRLKSNPDQLIGMISLMADQPDNRGFWLGVPWQGQGLMTEASEAATGYWFEKLEFPVLRAAKAIANAASRRISEKNGMRVVGVEERDYVSGRYLTEVWEITAEEWRVRRKGAPARG